MRWYGGVENEQVGSSSILHHLTELLELIRHAQRSSLSARRTARTGQARSRLRSVSLSRSTSLTTTSTAA